MNKIREKDNWLKGIAQWRIRNTLYLSVVFTWNLPEARRIAEANQKLRVIAGGPAVRLLPKHLADVATVQDEIGLGDVEPVMWHNPLAGRSTAGCPNACKFCAVPKIEGKFRELEKFRIGPYMRDDNFLAATRGHFDRVIDALKSLPFVDFNQGLEASKFTSYHAGRMAELKHAKIRFSLDSWKEQSGVADAVKTAREAGLKDFGIYVLIGFDDTPEEAKEKLEWVRSLGIRPNPMRYQPLIEPYCLVKNSYVADGWTDGKLKDMSRYYSNLAHLDNVPFEEYHHVRAERQEADLFGRRQ
jgi:hypothetical protein